MKFLESEFEESLLTFHDEANGLVYVSGIPYSPAQILRVNQNYDSEFNSWKLETWLPSRTEKLNGILDLRDNRKRYAELARLIKDDLVFPFVGSGMSSPSGIPLWGEFLNKYLRPKAIKNQDQITSLIDANDYEAAATLLEGSIPKKLFEEVMEHTFRVFSPIEILGPVKYLPQLFKSTVFTTNYDNILEETFIESDLGFNSILFGRQIEDHKEFRKNQQRCLLKLHGDFRRVGTRVLTKSEYRTCYGKNKAFQSELTFIYQRFSLLFLGCSLENDRTLTILENISKKDDNMPKHFAFLKIPTFEEEILQREHFLTERGIFPIWFSVEDNNYDEPIETLLIGLMHETGRL
jgi:hypothetical protein